MILSPGGAPTYLLAGSRERARDFARRHDIVDYRYVSSADALRGVVMNPQDEVVIVEGFLQRPDAQEIREMVRVCQEAHKVVGSG